MLKATAQRFGYRLVLTVMKTHATVAELPRLE